MRDDSDFAAYLSARWPSLVRTLVLLGARPDEAEDAVRSGLSRCYVSWARISDDDDPDAHVYRAVLDAWDRRPAGWWETPPPEPHAEPAPELVELTGRLDRLTPARRLALVLRLAAGLEPLQVADVLDVPPDDAAYPAEDVFREAAEFVDTLPPPLEVFQDRAREQRRRRRTSSATAAAVAVVLLGTATWLGTRPDPAPAAARPVVTVVENPADVVWWANGQLHLEHLRVEAPPLADLAAINDGAVYGDEDGGVVVVARDGAVTRIGTKVPRAPLVASDERGWVAWVDPGDREPQLIVYDVVHNQVLATLALPYRGDRWGSRDPGSYPIALDQSSVYYAAQDGDHEWSFVSSEPEAVEPVGLLDVRRATRVWQMEAATIKIVQPLFSLAFARPGRGAQMASDGERVLTHTHDRARSQSFGRVRIYDTRTGEALWTGLTDEDVAVAATWGPEGTVSYVIAHRADQPRSGEFLRQSFSGPYELRTCNLETRRCVGVASFPHVGRLPMLAR